MTVTSQVMSNILVADLFLQQDVFQKLMIGHSVRREQTAMYTIRLPQLGTLHLLPLLQNHCAQKVNIFDFKRKWQGDCFPDCSPTVPESIHFLFAVVVFVADLSVFSPLRRFRREIPWGR